MPLTDMDQAFAPNQPIVLIDASTGQRQLIWSELDSNAIDPGEHRPDHPGRAAT